MDRKVTKVRNRTAAIVLSTGIVALAMVSHPVAAAPITFGESSVNSSFTVKWEEDVVGDDGEGITLSGELNFRLDAFNDDSLDFWITAENTTVHDFDGRTGLTAFGFNTVPDLTDAEIDPDGEYFKDVDIDNVNIAGGYRVDLCTYTGQNCQSAGDEGFSGLPDGESDAFGLSLFGDFSGGEATFSDFTVRYAGDFGSFTFPTNGNGNGFEPPVEIPTPAPLALLGLGLVGMYLLRGRKRAL